MAGEVDSDDGAGVQPEDRFFVNVDLDIDSAEDLGPLVRALEPDACSLERPPGRASFELNVSVSLKSPEPLILAFVRVIANLTPDARAIWDRAARRTLDLGFQSGHRPHQETHRLSAATLHAVSTVGADIAVTVYGLEPADGIRSAG